MNIERGRKPYLYVVFLAFESRRRASLLCKRRVPRASNSRSNRERRCAYSSVRVQAQARRAVRRSNGRDTVFEKSPHTARVANTRASSARKKRHKVMIAHLRNKFIERSFALFHVQKLDHFLARLVFVAVRGSKSLLRRLINACDEINALAYEQQDTAQSIVDMAGGKILGLSEETAKGDFTHIRDVLIDTYAQLDEIIKNKGEANGIPSGFSEVDKLLVGFGKGDLAPVSS